VALANDLDRHIGDAVRMSASRYGSTMGETLFLEWFRDKPVVTRLDGLTAWTTCDGLDWRETPMRAALVQSDRPTITEIDSEQVDALFSPRSDLSNRGEHSYEIVLEIAEAGDGRSGRPRRDLSERDRQGLRTAIRKSKPATPPMPPWPPPLTEGDLADLDRFRRIAAEKGQPLVRPLWTLHTLQMWGNDQVTEMAVGAVQRLGHAAHLRQAPREAGHRCEILVVCQLEFADDYSAAWLIGELDVLAEEHDGHYYGWEITVGPQEPR
jgi:hypothetical protein